MLFIISTPIGNLEDITFRAINTLKSVDAICAEDTRTASILLRHYQISKPIFSFHAHSKKSQQEQILLLLKQGKNIALISEAGTPGISDPGWSLIHEAIAFGIRIVPIPGPSAFLTALVGSGLPMDKFLYLGFLPLKKGRQSLLKALTKEKRTIIWYESPHRLLRTVMELQKIFPPETNIVIARELTKIYEEFIRGSLNTVSQELQKRHSIKGEIVILLKNP